MQFTFTPKRNSRMHSCVTWSLFATREIRANPRKGFCEHFSRKETNQYSGIVTGCPKGLKIVCEIVKDHHFGKQTGHVTRGWPLAREAATPVSKFTSISQILTTHLGTPFRPFAGPFIISWIRFCVRSDEESRKKTENSEPSTWDRSTINCLTELTGADL